MVTSGVILIRTWGGAKGSGICFASSTRPDPATVREPRWHALAGSGRLLPPAAQGMAQAAQGTPDTLRADALQQGQAPPVVRNGLLGNADVLVDPLPQLFDLPTGQRLWPTAAL